MKEAIEKHDMAAWKESFVGGTLVSVERCLKFPRVREGYCSATIQSLFGITRKWEIVGTLACVKLRKRRKDPCLEWWTSDVAVTLITETRGNEELIEGRKEVWYKIQGTASFLKCIWILLCWVGTLWVWAFDANLQRLRVKHASLVNWKFSNVAARYQIITLDWTPEMELFWMLLGRCLGEIRKTSPKNRTESFISAIQFWNHSKAL